MLELELSMVQDVAKAVHSGEWPREAAIRLTSCTRKEWRTWWELGESVIDTPEREWTDGERLAAMLVQKVLHAEAEFEAEMLRLAKEHAVNGKGTWTGFITILERRFPDRWRKREMEKKGRDVFDPDAEMRRLSEKRAKGADEAADARDMLGG